MELFEDNRLTKPELPNLDDPRILELEVLEAIRISKNCKAPDPDSVNSEMIKALDSFSTDKLTELYNEIYECGHLPDDFLDSVFISPPPPPPPPPPQKKKQTNKQTKKKTKKKKAKERSDFRTISFMSHP